MSFSTVPVRENDREILASWFNVLRTAGVAVENYLGSVISETQFNLANNQSAPANITGLLFDPGTIGVFLVDYRVYRKTTDTGATELAEGGALRGIYSPVAGTWELTQDRGGDAGITFSVTNAGQIQYTSSNIAGTPASSYIRFKARTMGL